MVVVVVGKRAADEGKVSMRCLGSQASKVFSLDEAVAALEAGARPPALVG
jgi:threonyl-tRNA synthetase